MDDQLENPLAIDGEAANRFWEWVRTDEGLTSAEATILWDELEARGWQPPEPEDVSDADLPAVIEKLVMDLSWLHVYVNFMDHLPDRELYEVLFERVFEYDHCIYPDDPEGAVSFGILDSYDLEDHLLYLRYYANEDGRADRASASSGARIAGLGVAPVSKAMGS